MPRLTKIVTRTGDTGDTGLADGSRRKKTDLRIVAIGEVDELNSCLGMLLAHVLPEEIRPPLLRAQHELFDLGGELSQPGAVLIDDDMLAGLEATAQALNAGLPPLREFVLPGGNSAAAAAHVARAVARRAERAVWRLAAAEAINPMAARYLNRLSDVLFICARQLAREGIGQEVVWQRRGRR